MWGMVQPYRRYIAIETCISIAINVIFSALFMIAVFGRSPLIGLWGAHGLALDFIPQTFMISAMSVLVPTLLTRRRARRGILEIKSRGTARIVNHLGVRVLLIASLLTMILSGVALAILALSWAGPLRFWQVFPMKLLYGGVVALIATPIGLSIALSEKQ